MRNELPSDKLLAATLRAIGDAVISCDRDGNVVLMNPVAQELTGWAEDEARGRNLKQVFVIVNESTRAVVEDPVDKVLRLGGIVGMANHTILVRRDGTELSIDDSAAPVTDDDDQLTGVVLVFRDVTTRRRAEWNVEMLSQSGRVLGESREFSVIVEQISKVIATHFADFCVFDFLDESGRLSRTVGNHRVPELQRVADGMVRFQPRPAPSVHPVTQVLATRKSQLLADPTDHVLEQMTVGAEHRAYYDELKAKSILSVPLLAGDRLLGVLTCVRHRLALQYDEQDVAAAEELGKRIGLALHYATVRDDLRMERARVDAILATVPVGIIMAETSGKIVLANEEVNQIFRHQTHYSQDVASHAEYVAYHPDGRRVQGEEYPLSRAMQEDRVIRDERYLYAKGDGTQGWISLSAAPVKDDAGHILGGVVAISDIDELVKAQESAERSEKRVQTMMARASVGVAVGDFDGGLSYANDVLLSWIGYSREELKRGEVRWDRMTPPEFVDRDIEALEELRRDCVCAPYEKVYLAKDGHRVPLLVGATCIPALDEKQKRDDIAVFYTDLTLQKRAEQVLLQTEKLTAVGRLASSISHEINNPLEAVVNLLFIVRNSPNLAQSDKDYLEAADRELARVSQITAQTLRFHRQSTAATEVRPENLLGEVLALYRTRLSASNITIQRDYGDTVAFTCFEGDVRQVLNNLVGNAFDAMRNGGTLHLRTRCATWWPTGAKGVMLTMADTGSGMPHEVQKRIFDAFYSTKGIHGTGLGLWISKRIVHKHRGHLCVRSSTGEKHGTVFQLWMPVQLAATANESWHPDDAVETSD